MPANSRWDLIRGLKGQSNFFVKFVIKYEKLSKSLFTVSVSVDDKERDVSLRTLQYKFGKAVSLRKKPGIVHKCLKTPQNKNVG